MGCDIHSFIEVRKDGQWHHLGGDVFPDHQYDKTEPFGDVRSYAIFGFLADVRNYSQSPVIVEPRGVPDDLSSELRDEYGDSNEWWGSAYHSASWLTVAELQAYDYNQIIWDRRITREVSPGHFNGAALAEEGEGRHLPLRDFLGEYFFRVLDDMAALGDPADVRMVFWFDS
jgi:hypothetical protein